MAITLPNYKLAHFLRSIIPQFCTKVATLLSEEQNAARYYHVFHSSIFRSFLGKIRVAVRLPDSSYALIRLFSFDDVRGF